MQIDKNQTIANFPILLIRKLLKDIGTFIITFDFVMEKLSISKRQALILLTELSKQGLIKNSTEKNKVIYWEITSKGNQLVLASTAKPISKNTADKSFNEFLERVVIVRDDNRFAFKVSEVILFGSYLNDQEFYGDIDLHVQLVPKESDERKHQEKCDNIIKQSGKQFSTYLNKISWPANEVYSFIKGRSRVISLHSGDPIINMVKTKVVYSDK